MTTREQQPEQVIAHGVVIGEQRVDGRRAVTLEQSQQGGGFGLLPDAYAFPSQQVDRPATRSEGQPGSRLRGYAVTAPDIQRSHDGVLDRVLSELQ